MNRKYNLKLDLQFRCNNSIMKFNQFDNNTSDFFMKISSGGKSFDVEKAIVVLATIKPSGKVASQFVEIENGLVYADLKPNMVDEIGIYTAQAMLILEDERVVTDVISYEVEEDKIFSLLNDTVGTSEEFTLLTDMLSRLSTIEISEEQRVINEAERILSEENRKIEEAKRVEVELIRQHEEADRAKYDATRESNENIRKINEEARISSENVRLENEANRIEQEANRVKAEQLRKDNYNLMTEDEERRRSEANAHKEAETLRVSAENTRVNEEAKRRTTEQARVSAENTRVSNENTRKANEVTRQTNETQRVEAETQRQNRYNSFIADAEANTSNFENYTNTAKVKEEERKANELDRKSQENRRVSNEVERISNENTRKANEVVREKNEASRQNTFTNKVNEVDKKIVEMNTTKDNFISNINTKVDTKISEIDNAKSDMTNTVSNKVNEVETRFNDLTSSQQQDAEVIDARDGETSLKARLDRDIEKTNKELDRVKKLEESTVSTVETESDFTTVEATSGGYFEDVKLEGKTLVNLWDISKMRKASSISVANNYVTVNADGSWIDCHPVYKAGTVPMLKPNTEYTVIAHVKNNTLNNYMSLNVDNANRSPFMKNVTLEQGFTGYYICKLNTKTDLSKSDTSLRCQIGSGCTTGSIIFNCILLEGDHTQNPPNGYIEGLKSVGQDVDEVSVLSVNEREYIDGSIVNDVWHFKEPISSGYFLNTSDKIIGLSIINSNNIWLESKNINPNECFDVSNKLNYGEKVSQILFSSDVGWTFTPNPNLTNYIIFNKDMKQDKKRLLYYNDETQTWEKPILREWDNIEKHANGKYYYHKRSAEVVLNGSENWLKTSSQPTSGNHSRFIITNFPKDVVQALTVVICDKYNNQKLFNESSVGIYVDKNINITVDGVVEVEEFKNNLNTNNVTVVYQLAQEKVYECTNIDLITYANETNYVVESGVLSPRTTLKVHNNISNVVSLLQKKVSLLESNVTSYMITQNRLMLASRYNADNVTFKVDYPSMMSEREVEIDYDLFKLIQDNIIVGPENYDVDKMLEIMDLYAMIGFITWEMWDYLYEVIDSQINPVIGDLEGAPEI